MSRSRMHTAVRATGLLAIALVAGCASPVSLTPAATPTPASNPSSPGQPASATPTAYPTATLFTSPLYKYSVNLAAGWLVIPAQTPWDGRSPVGHDDPIVDQLIAPQVPNRCATVFVCGPLAWAYATPTTRSLDAWVADQDASDARDHPCPPSPQTRVSVKVDGEPGVLESKHCPQDGGILVMSAHTIRDGVGYAFYLQDPSGEPGVEPLDQSDFRALLGAIRLPR
jgi:hypothetical protein